LVWITLLLATSAFASTRYVDNSGTPPCVDTQAYGTETQPWCTISYAIRNLNGGDDLFVKHGTYNEGLYINGPAGTSTKDTIIRTYPGHSVIIRGTGNSGRVRITATSYVTFDGFEITNFNQGIFVDGASSHVTVRNCTVHDVGQEGIHVKENSSFVKIEGCTIFNTQKLGGCCNGEGIYVGTSSSGPLDNTNNVTLANNVIHDTTDEGIELKPGTHHCLADGNTLYNIVMPQYSASAAGVIEVNERDLSPQTWSGNPSHLITNNVVYNSTTAIRLGTGSTAYNNVIYSPLAGRFGIYVNNNNSDSFTRFIYHNTIHMTADAVVVAGGTLADVRNNIGPTTSTSNLAFTGTYFVDASAHNYHLVPGVAAVNAGENLLSIVATDKDGVSRAVGGAADIGAYELGASPPAAPTNLRITRQ